VNAFDDRLAGAPEQKPGATGPAAETAPARRSASLEARWLTGLMGVLGNPPLEMELWTGEVVATASAPVARIKLRDRKTLMGLLSNPQVRFGDAYSEGTIEIEGDMVRLLEEVYRAGSRAGKKPKSLLQRIRSRHRPRLNTLAGSRDNIHHHYDIGNPFYQLWLGPTMQYTCAYYPVPTATLDEAQAAKMHHVARKLRLKAGETVVEAGCGWGALALHLARYYGVKVRAYNISKEQVAFARERVKAEGLDSQVEYVLDDYRTIKGHYDAFVSIGMLEHVGVPNYEELGRVVSNAIGSNGRGLIHTIGRNRPSGPLHPWIEKRIFPGAYPPSLGEMSQIFEPYSLSILDVENLRLHYAQTLRHWLELYEGSIEQVRAMFDERFVRMWRLYLCGSIAAFTTGGLQLFQVLFAPQGSNDVPLTRNHLYA
jgi:cyclopropane-fatty-acyl-phospholipid synthase